MTTLSLAITDNARDAEANTPNHLKQEAGATFGQKRMILGEERLATISATSSGFHGQRINEMPARASIRFSGTQATIEATLDTSIPSAEKVCYSTAGISAAAEEIGTTHEDVAGALQEMEGAVTKAIFMAVTRALANTILEARESKGMTLEQATCHVLNVELPFCITDRHDSIVTPAIMWASQGM